MYKLARSGAGRNQARKEPRGTSGKEVTTEEPKRKNQKREGLKKKGKTTKSEGIKRESFKKKKEAIKKRKGGIKITSSRWESKRGRRQ
jgi:hypothetical protein